MNMPSMNEIKAVSAEKYIAKKITKWKVLKLKHKSHKISLPSLNSGIQLIEKKS